MSKVARMQGKEIVDVKDDDAVREPDSFAKKTKALGLFFNYHHFKRSLSCQD